MAEGTKVNTLVFMDLETTGLKSKVENPEITELFLLSVGREEFMSQSENKVQNSLKLAFKTEKGIPKRVSELTGLTDAALSDQELLNAKTFELLNLFLSRLNKPVCFLAHNGKRFDFALLRDEQKQVEQKLMADLLCADTLEGFKYIDKQDVVTGMEELSVSNSPSKLSYSLREIYKRKFDGKIEPVLRAEFGVNMMYELALLDKENFLSWVDEKAVPFSK